MSKENEIESDKMAENAKSMMEYAQGVLEEAMESCQIEGFSPVPLNIPISISETKDSILKLDQGVLWGQIANMYDSQSQLFSGEVQDQSKPEVAIEGNESQLDEISKMLGV